MAFTNLAGVDAYLVFLEVVRQVGNHDLGLGWHTVLRRATLLALTWRVSLLGSRSSLSALLSCEFFVRRFDKWVNLARYICRNGVGGSSSFAFGLFGALSSSIGLLALTSARLLYSQKVGQLTARPPRPVRPPRPRPRPRPRVEARRRCSVPLAPSAPLPEPSA